MKIKEYCEECSKYDSIFAPPIGWSCEFIDRTCSKCGWLYTEQIDIPPVYKEKPIEYVPCTPFIIVKEIKE